MHQCNAILELDFLNIVLTAKEKIKTMYCVSKTDNFTEGVLILGKVLFDQELYPESDEGVLGQARCGTLRLNVTNISAPLILLYS